ncbi:MAG: hypothetical protein ACTJFR_04210 [Canibacter sp.]
MNSQNSEPTSRPGKAWSLLIGVLIIETIGAAALTWIAVTGAIGAVNQPFTDVMSLLVMAVIAFVFTIVCLAGALARRGWSRAASLTLQILAFAVATAMLQGILGTKTLAWLLIVMTIVGIIGVVLARSPDQMLDNPDDQQRVEDL